ncbi:MAG: hypothetical protein ACRDL2_11360, partial [Gaiellaceae bacterium]
GCLATVAAAATGPPKIPFHPSGSVVGEGKPLKAYANIIPAVHLFGDTIRARLAVVGDTRWVDPERLRVSVAFAPYQQVKPPARLTLHVGRFEQITWTWTLRCLSAKCVPVVPPSEKYHIFRFPQAHIRYLRPNGDIDFQIAASWPTVEVLSQVSPGVVSALALRKYDWQYTLAPVAAPTFRIRPTLLFWLAIGMAGALLVGALLTSSRWYLGVRPARATAQASQGTPLERALTLLRWARAEGDETLQRKALERVADELSVGGLSETAHELAWSPRVPEDEEIEALADEAREVGE